MFDVIEIDATTGEMTERAFTPEELAQRKADEKAAAVAAKAADAEAALRDSARKKIAAASGLTPEEMRALGFAV